MRRDTYGPVRVACVHCPWQAEHPDPRNTDRWTLEEVTEVSALLRRLLLAHIAEAHADRQVTS